MAVTLILIAVVLLLCVFSSKLLYRFGIPALLIFLVLGMLFGSDGIVGIHFDDYSLVETISSFCLIFIMFYGGFGTNWKTAKPMMAPSIWLATAGVIVTAVLTGWFCCVVLHTTLLEGLLFGAVIASTDAASVFSILRSRKLNLKGGLAPLLEVESGSNDPISYMLTIVILTIMSSSGASGVLPMVFAQILFGLGIGLGLAWLSTLILKKINFEIQGLYTIYVVAAVILGYALCQLTGGNSYLCVYIMGIVLGNTKIKYKRTLVHFFDGISWIMQMVLFFMLGLLSFPSQIPSIILPAVFIALFLIFVARPAAVFGILSFFHFPVKEKLFVSWVGMRGAASIVFAIFAITFGVGINNDIFHIVFFVALFSVAVQGTLTPVFAKKLGLVEKENSVFKTFTDYQDEAEMHLMEVTIDKRNPWNGRSLIEANISSGVLVVMIKRNGESIIPNGSTVLLTGDILVLSGDNFDEIPL
ncbi:MAG: potassium/proton antiporter [Christensenella sp.]|nr:potassium/proton antiporter [Christensenella sp.]